MAQELGKFEAIRRGAAPPGARGERFTKVLLEYERSFGMNIRFKTRGGSAPVLRMLWLKKNDLWRLAVYDVEVP